MSIKGRIEDAYDREWCKLYVIASWDKVKRSGRATQFKPPNYTPFTRARIMTKVCGLRAALFLMKKMEASIGE